MSIVGFALGGLALLVVAIAGMLEARAGRDRLAPAGDLLDRVLASRAARVAILVFWWWLGWHVLVARTVDPAAAS